MLSADAPVSQPLLTAAVAEASHAELAAISERTGTKIAPRLFVGASDLPATEREQIQIAYGSPDLVRMGAFGQFFDLIETLPRLRWLRLGFAGIEPLAAESPLWDMPNVIITPHATWAAQGNFERARLIFLRNLESWLRGCRLSTEVYERRCSGLQPRRARALR